MAFTETATSGRPFEIVFRAFGAGRSGKFRREALEHAAQAHFGAGPQANEHMKFLKKVVGHVGAASRRRDEIALGRVLDPPQAKGWLLLPPRYNTKLTRVENPDDMGYEGANYRHTAQDLQLFGSKFNALRGALDQYRQQVLRGDFRPPM